MHEALAVSLVVCTRNRAGQLADHLEAVGRIRSRHAWEYLLVDNGSTDDTFRILEAYGTTMPAHWRFLREERKGLSNARNCGWKAARGEVIAFTDDDCYPQPDFIDCLVECFDEQPSLAYLGGRVTLHDPDDLPIAIQTRTDRRDIAPASFVPVGIIHGANLAVRRSVLESHGGFDRRLGAGSRYGSAEDTELVGRYSAAGLTGAYDPRPSVSHHHRRRTAEAPASLADAYACGRGVYYLSGLMRPSVRKQYARQWYWSLQKQPWQTCGREFQAAISFLAQYGWRGLWSSRWQS